MEMHNKLNFKNSCPECNSNIIYDNINGESICSTCGYVLEDQMEDFGLGTYQNIRNNQTNPRSKGFNNISFHDFGLHTEIDNKGTDYSGKSFNEGVKKNIVHLRKWNTIIRISNSKERRLSNILIKINEICSSGIFPNVVCETAALIYRIYENKYDTKGKSSICMASALVYYACKICSIVRSLAEIVKLCSTEEGYKIEININDPLKNFNKKSSNQNQRLSNMQTISISQYISKLANLSNFDTKIERLALDIAKKTENHLLSDCKSPNGLAAAYLYLSSILLGMNILHMDISKLAGVTEVTIRNRCKDILTSYRISIRIKPSSNNYNHN